MVQESPPPPPELEEEIDLRAPLTSDPILQVRTGRMAPLAPLSIKSGINKTPRAGPVQITKLGLEGDEQDPTFHGGVEKAVHGYCAAHYKNWQKEFPQSADKFVPGGFGENLVLGFMNERNVCIGDVFEISDSTAVLQISLPRQPCFKLNHRFHLPNFAPNTYRLSRTGYYFRVLVPGPVTAGNRLILQSRPHPDWTIERIQRYLHLETDNYEKNLELSQIEEFGAECKDNFTRRVLRARAKANKKPKERWVDYKVVEKRKQTGRITSFVLEAAAAVTSKDGNDVEEKGLNPGAHAKVKLGNGLVRAYSIVDGDRERFQLAISLEEKSRGGSRYMHHEVEVGDVLQVGAITAAVPIVAAASHHIFVAGGVGITAFLAMVEFYKRIHYSVVLHYAVRSAEEVPFRERVEELKKEGQLVLYDKAAGQRMDIRQIIESRGWNSQLYFCGPKRLMDQAEKEVANLGVDQKEVHYEAFEADISGDPFEAVVANKGGVVVKVGEDETLLEVLQKQFDQPDSSCCVGNCKTCLVQLKAGRVDHRGTALTDEEKANSLLSCVSRGVGRITIEI
ncbi:putative phthalate 4, 5 dioxygenase oxygenase reductase subunit [Triangularia verruculosa]|uniref:Phthalate 4, 5 dioxygenase oxygenase reductase subunit n=1 Tax=Triangularia verruculosa TaxID=2587418 RepID=A0AAN7ANT5_9PEZI|nr:putative phthalate 4, 5 dioxygenase oxygenase reductase subunit [Triangularia verruculosa]